MLLFFAINKAFVIRNAKLQNISVTAKGFSSFFPTFLTAPSTESITKKIVHFQKKKFLSDNQQDMA